MLYFVRRGKLTLSRFGRADTILGPLEMKTPMFGDTQSGRTLFKGLVTKTDSLLYRESNGQQSVYYLLCMPDYRDHCIYLL